MILGRRDFLAGAGALALSSRPTLAALQTAPRSSVFPPMVRTQFPGASVETYLNAAAIHPLGTFAARAIEQTRGVSPAWRRRGPRRLRSGQAERPQGALSAS